MENPFSPEEEHALRMIILVLGSVSLVTGLFVIVTFLAFAEKRKFGAWSLNCMFVVCVSMTELLLLIGGAMGFSSLENEDGTPSPFCIAQGLRALFFIHQFIWGDKGTFYFFHNPPIPVCTLTHEAEVGPVRVSMGSLFAGLVEWRLVRLPFFFFFFLI